MGSRTSRNSTNNNVSANQTEEIPEFLSEFFQKEIKDYLLGGLTCEFCQYKTLPWPTLTNDSNNNKVSKETTFKSEFQEFFCFILNFI